MDVGDRRDFAELYQAHYARIRHYAARQFGADEAEDIAQETMLRAMLHPDAVAGDQPAAPWLTTVARRIGIDHLRRRRPVHVDDDVLLALSPAAPDETANVVRKVDVGGLLHRALGRLSVLDRQVLTLHYVHDIDVTEIAARTGAQPNAVRQRLFRARRNLARQYHELGGGQYSLPVGSAEVARLRPRANPVGAVRRTATRVVEAVQARTSATPQGGGRVAAVAATLAMSATVTVAPPVRGAPEETPPARPPVVEVDPRAVDEAVRTVPPLVREVEDRLRPVTGSPQAPGLPLPFREDWENGLAGWAVAGSSAAVDCAVRQAGQCSLWLRPADHVTVTRPVGTKLAAQTTFTVGVHGDEPASGSAAFTFDVLLGAAAVSLDVTRQEDDDEVRVRLRSSATPAVAEFSLPGAAWLNVWLRLDSTANRVHVGVTRFSEGKSLPLSPGVERLDRMGLTARRLTGAGGAFWVDPLAVNSNVECMDGRDNDGDGRVDGADTGCGDVTDDTESPNPECDDGIDNDGDGKIDFGGDPSCGWTRSLSESATCDNGLDDDGDGAVDYPHDAECTTEADLGEAPRCQDGHDDDQDAAVDLDDLGCTGVDDDTEWGCYTLRTDTRGMTAVETVWQQTRPLFTGVCLDPAARVADLAAVPPAAARDVRGYVDEYELVVPVAGRSTVHCVVLLDRDLGTDPCATAGGRFVRRVAALVRVDADSAGAPRAGRVGICTASVSVVVRNEQYVDTANRYPVLLGLCAPR